MLMISSLAKRGVLVAYALNNVQVIRLEPPLMITREEIDTVLAAMREAVIETMALLATL
jgi:putrescine aminotransferase